MTYLDLLARTRVVWLGQPTFESVGNAAIHWAMQEHAQLLMNRLNMTAFPWALKSTRLDIVAAQSIYPIAEADFTGGAYLCEKNPDVYGSSDGPGEVRILTSPADFDLVPGASEPITADADPTPDSVVAIAIYRDGNTGRWVVRSGPAGGAGFYRLWYEVGLVQPGALDGDPALPPQFHTLLCLMAASTVVDDCRWKDLTDQQNEARRAAKRSMIGDNLATWQRTFEDMRLLPQTPQIGSRTPFGAERRGIR